MPLAPLSLCAALVLALPHPDSLSRSRIEVSGSRASLALAVQSRSLDEALGLDLDGDGRLDAAELEAGRPAIEGYVLERYRVQLAEERSSALPGTLETLEPFDQGGAFLGEPWVRMGFSFRAQEPPRELWIACELFREENPLHRDSATLAWEGEEPASWLFGAESGVWHFQPAARRRPGVLASYIGLGVHHILGGWDHIAFLVALLVASRRLRSLAGVVTAFTAAHSLTLALAALGTVQVPARLVELAIALSIAYVAFENLVLRSPGTRWFEAFGFGLVHGLGFAGFLGESLVFEPLVATALVGFNLGVELGQLAIVAVLALALRALPGDRRHSAEPRAWLAPRWARLAASGAVAAAGLYWFGERSGLY